MANSNSVKLLKEMLINAAKNLEKEKSSIDNLNVFPVPDGDTGTNMSLTLKSAAGAITDDLDSLETVSSRFSHGALMGARGNSGVILSQLISGFAKGLKGQEELNAIVLVDSLQKGVEAAYKAVSNPVEGTILTVSRESVENLSPDKDMDIIILLEEIIQKGKESLARTPELLPILKQSGVVDAGGMGYLVFLNGMLMALKGEEIPFMDDFLADMSKDSSGKSGATITFSDDFDHENINFQYCTELLLSVETGEEFDTAPAIKMLNTIGDSVLVIESEGIVKVHTHTNEPWQVLEFFGQFGSLNDIKIDNMKAQSKRKYEESEKDLAIISVSYGDGFNAIFKSLGTNYIISGGQTMNPSTEDILEAMRKNPAKEYIILPNNKNIILAAEQAAKISDKKLHIIYSKTIPQGITSLMSFNPEMSAEENEEVMNDMIKSVKSIEITQAVRDTIINGLDIKEGQYIAIAEGEIVFRDNDLYTSVVESIKKEIDEDSEIVTLYFGEDIDEEAAEELVNELSELYDEIDFELHNGGQPLYPYIISIE
jgi:DAK2 domain fusion protein YloV